MDFCLLSNSFWISLEILVKIKEKSIEYFGSHRVFLFNRWYFLAPPPGLSALPPAVFSAVVEHCAAPLITLQSGKARLF